MTDTAIPLSRHPTTDPMSVDQLVQMLLSAGEESEAAIGAVVNSIFVQSAPEQVQQVHDRLTETDSILAEQFKAMAVRGASVRTENGKPDSYPSFFQSLVGHVHDAMTQLAGEDYEAQIEETEDNRILTICADTEDCMESPFPYTEKALSRAEAFMMVYDPLKIAGVGGHHPE